MSSLLPLARVAPSRPLAPSRLAARRRLLGSALGLTLLAVAGCGKAAPERVPTFPVQGTITFKGKPPVGAVVALHPKNEEEAKGLTPHANVAADGTFALTTYNGGDGAPEGDYVVTVLWYKPIQNGPDKTSGPNVIPPKYTSPTTSDLVVKVAAGPNTLKPIQL